MTYYDRQAATHLDGSRVFASPDDARHEAEVASLCEAAWRCELRRFGALAAVDWFATRHERLVGVLELKTRSHASDRHPTVWLNVRKWLALHLAATGLGVPALFVVRFVDVVRWVNLADVAASAVRIGGTRRVVKSRSDIEPVIEVPVDAMTQLVGAPMNPDSRQRWFDTHATRARVGPTPPGAASAKTPPIGRSPRRGKP